MRVLIMDLFTHLEHIILYADFSIRLYIKTSYNLFQIITHCYIIQDVHRFLAKYCCYSMSLHISRQYQTVHKYSKTMSICFFTPIPPYFHRYSFHLLFCIIVSSSYNIQYKTKEYLRVHKPRVFFSCIIS